MFSSTIFKFKWKLRKWSKTFALFDITVLGFGLLSVILYLTIKTVNEKSNSPYFDVWVNLATEILGAWIIIRIIDFLNKKSIEKFYKNQEIWSLLQKLTVQIKLHINSLTFTSRTAYIYLLENYLQEIEKLVEVNEKYLSSNQITDTIKIKEIFKKIIKTIKKLHLLEEKIEGMFMKYLSIHSDKNNFLYTFYLLNIESKIKSILLIIFPIICEELDEEKAAQVSIITNELYLELNKYEKNMNYKGYEIFKYMDELKKVFGDEKISNDRMKDIYTILNIIDKKVEYIKTIGYDLKRIELYPKIHIGF